MPITLVLGRVEPIDFPLKITQPDLGKGLAYVSVDPELVPPWLVHLGHSMTSIYSISTLGFWVPYTNSEGWLKVCVMRAQGI